MTLSELSAKAPGSLLLMSELLMLWSAANYAVAADPVRATKRVPIPRRNPAPSWIAILIVRSVLLGIGVVVVAGTSAGSLLLAAALTGVSLILPLARLWWVGPEHGAELEITVAVLVVGFVVAGVVHWRLMALVQWTALPFSETRKAAFCLIVATVLFSVRGGTYMVRGILNKCGVLPELAVPEESSVTPRPSRVVGERRVDALEFNRGRWIGNLERVLLLAIVADTSYSALAFLMAAKTLIRSRELENREWPNIFCWVR